MFHVFSEYGRKILVFSFSSRENSCFLFIFLFPQPSFTGHLRQRPVPFLRGISLQRVSPGTQKGAGGSWVVSQGEGSGLAVSRKAPLESRQGGREAMEEGREGKG